MKGEPWVGVYSLGEVLDKSFCWKIIGMEP